MLLKLLGYEHGELIGASVETLVPDAFRGTHATHRANYVASPTVRQMGSGLELFARRKDGSSVPVEIGLSHANGLTIAFVSDISARKQAIAERELLIIQLQVAVEEKIVLIKEVHHRVKNNLAVVSGLLALQANSIGDQRLAIALEESQQRISSMALVHEYLYSSERLDRIDFGQYLRRLLAQLTASHMKYAAQATLTVSIDDIELAVDQAIPCGLIVNELVSNAFKHAFPASGGGEIHVSLISHDNGEVVLSCRDNGVGIAANIDWRTSPSMGLELVRGLAGQVDGEFTQDERQSVGTGFELRFKRRDDLDLRASRLAKGKNKSDQPTLPRNTNSAIA
jgi:PAS domain S-box-containing protein